MAMSRSLGCTSLMSRPPISIRAAVERLKAGQHPQRGGLARARRADKDHELAVLDVEVERVDSGGDALGVDAARGLGT